MSARDIGLRITFEAPIGGDRERGQVAAGSWAFAAG